jgi:pSer/pThr/pTyr-binding forkhead associated (FHA) protein
MHAEIEFRADGGVVIRDLGSRNGTLLNGSAIEDECPLRLGDRVKLGASGPEFLIELLEGGHAPAAAVAGDDRAQQVRESDPRRSYGGKGATVFFQDLIEESSRKTHARTRWVVWTSVVLLAGAMGVMYWVSEVRVRETGRMLAEQRATADSLQREAEAEYVRLRGEFDAARASAAPTAVLDSLRQALTEAGERTDALEAALQRAQVDLNRQLSVGDSMQRAAQQELARVRTSGDRTTGLAAPCSQASRGAGCRHRNRLAGGARLRPVDCSSGQFGCRRIGHCCVWRRSLRGFWIRADIVWLFCH